MAAPPLSYAPCQSGGSKKDGVADQGVQFGIGVQYWQLLQVCGCNTPQGPQSMAMAGHKTQFASATAGVGANTAIAPRVAATMRMAASVRRIMLLLLNGGPLPDRLS